ncbi:mitogen-activated protein kinase kinase kinase 4 isoform X1 [Maniola jurtina]|uniref:mitogen-activated protein kinase kinase kinase 4 isoform X1 n=2 Tax=Maniola jurtina TaxID=191418 RepID=UPI001E68BC44|nr:mitogen-activated protein kinase kinase kinase 4 isoform X1 [Maniola jurtina]
MDSSANKDWKQKLGFPINYDSGQSSEEDFDANDVVMRHSRHSSGYYLAENGDGSEADLLGSTPPRARIRDKEKRRNIYESGTSLQKMLVEGKNLDDVPSPTPPERPRRRCGLKLNRSRERDWKDSQREPRADSLPSPSPQTAVPTLVESCSRFMSLTSRLKCQAACEEDVQERCADEGLPASRVNFHNTFSMLINMGNIEKGCRRTISREEQVWQNELKDLIWLELKAKLAGRSLSQQDEFLCSQRNMIPAIILRIHEYKFENPDPCRNRSRLLSPIEGSHEDISNQPEELNIEENNEDYLFGCVSFDCERCTTAVGIAMKQVAELLDAYEAAIALYPSSTAASVEHPALFSHRTMNRLRAMCLWYNTALHMRLKVLSVRRMLRTVREKSRHGLEHGVSTEPSSRKSSTTQRPCQVRFNVSNNTSDSNNSDSSGQSDRKSDHSDDQGKNPDEQGKNPDEQSNEVIEVATDDKGKGSDGKRGVDTTDCSGQEKLELTGDMTPEIVISETYSTSDTTASNESGYISAEQWCKKEQSYDVYDIGPLRDVAQLRLLGRTEVSAYRDYHYEMLKTQGVRRCMMFMNKMCNKLLNKVYLTLLEPQPEGAEEDVQDVLEDTKEAEQKTDTHNNYVIRNTYEFRRYGCWCEETLSMQLPSYRSHFLLLTSICMEAVHDYLSLRMEGRPEHPSCLTIKQLIHELKEGLDIAAEMRASFARNVEAALRGSRALPQTRRDLLDILYTFDATVETALQQYLSYLRTMSETEAQSRAALAAEWAFTARLAARAPQAAVLAPPAFADMACNQLNRVLKRFEDKFKQVMELEKSEHSDPDDQRYLVYTICREAQCVYASEREAALQAAQWARALASRLGQRHRVHCGRIFNSLIAIRDCLVRHTAYILERSQQEHLSSHELPKDIRDSMIARVRELLLQVYKLGFELHTELYKFAQAPLTLREREVRRMRPSSLQPSRPHTPQLRRKRPETMLVPETSSTANPMIHKELHRFVNDSPQCRAFSSRNVGGSPRKMRLLRSESIGEEGEASVMDTFVSPSLSDIEALLSGSKSAQAKRAEMDESTQQEAEWAKRVARAVIEFARCWMSFVVERCDRGRGLRPRWASQGLEFLMLACDPCNTKHLSDEEFEDLKQLMDGCISHVIGSRTPTPTTITPTAPHRRPRIHSPHSTSSTNSKESGYPPTPPSEHDGPLSLHRLEDTQHSKRVIEAIQRLDEARDEKLQQAKSVGKVLESTVKSYEPKLRQLTFKWQRGLKIGAGTFGKVYTVVNTESGQLLAMKELNIGAGDRRALQRAANELRVLEGVLHPHLVRYYGCELHREEMLLFMELCVEGSLEALVATSGALTEHTTRRYTKQLLSAVSELHSRSIAHRDIKSGNIFLTNEGHCLKLGDFGCAVKIRANTTAPGELQGYVGTQAYMAPEVFMKSSGHGRAADIWSLGCVTTEMASGKRPFSEYDSNYQIMFVVGMGGRPHIPDTLSPEGQQFCLSCLTHDPDLRPRAEALSLHHFLMVKSDDDCKCEPAYLIT